MSLWHRLLRLLGYDASTERLSFSVDVRLIRSLHNLAEHERRPQGELAAELLSYALAQRDAAEAHLQCWHALSTREQQVTALVCLGFTNRQIASRLVLSPETVKSHVARVLLKFGLRTRADLRRVLAEWDFGAWRET
jgi:DNA-binding NarL/FixJ family response regulator